MEDRFSTGLRIAEETAYKTVGGSEVWKQMEPNEYSDFGSELTLIARNPINASRQRKKGVITDLDASGGWQQDLTQNNLQAELQGLMFADLRPKAEFGGASQVTLVDGTAEEYDAASGLDVFAIGDLMFASGFTNGANNGLKAVTGLTGDTNVAVAENLLDETPPAAAKLVQVGHEFTVSTVDIDVTTGTLPRLSRASGAKDFTDFGLIPGEFIFIGGDVASDKFVGANNNGWARVRSVTASYIEFDKTDTTMTNETGTSLTIRIFFGRVLKNESDTSLITRRTYQLEQTLGAPDDSLTSEIQAQYLTGSLFNEFTINVPTAEKVTCDLGFISADAELYTGPTSLKAGTRPTLADEDAFNTSSDFTRKRMAVFTEGTTAPTPLFAYLTDFTLNVSNNASGNKACGVLGNFDVTAGQFTVGGSLTAYFSNVTAITAVRNNSDITLDMMLVKENAGICLDVPLIALGGGRPNIAQNEAITLPLDMEAATGAKLNSTLDYTLMWVFYDYLPDAADSA